MVIDNDDQRFVPPELYEDPEVPEFSDTIGLSWGDMYKLNMKYEVENQVEISVNDNEIVHGYNSDTETSIVSPGSSLGQFDFLIREGAVVRMQQESIKRDTVQSTFVKRMKSAGNDVIVECIHSFSKSSLMGQARTDAFRIFKEAVAKRRGGNANVRFAWYGNSWEEIANIVTHGFVGSKMGVHLSPLYYAIDSALASPVDGEGLRHVLVCKVIMGKMESVADGSRQVRPSSKEFDSGIDDLIAPRRYIVWSGFANCYILPIFIISFKSPAPLKDCLKPAYVMKARASVP